MSAQIHEFDPQIYPMILWVGIGVKESDVTEIFPEVDTFPIYAVGKTYNIYTAKSHKGRRGVLILYRDFESLDANAITHEAVHAGIYMFSHIGESINKAHQEPFAYLCGWIAKCIEEVKQHKNKK